jgi:hypothetical protein
MIRKLSHIILSALLLATTTGLLVSKHFCNEMLISTAVYAEAETCCETADCCNTETEIFQLDEEYSAPVVSGLPDLVELELPFSTAGDYNLMLSERINFLTIPQKEPPPPPTVLKFLSLRQTYLL